MNTSFNTEASANKGSQILNKFISDRKAEREAKASGVLKVQNAVDSELIKSGDPQVIQLFGGAPAASGYSVNEESAMRVSAVAACVQLLGGTIASLPLSVYKETSDGREKVKPLLWKLLNRKACPAWTAASMVIWWIRSIAFKGDAFTRIIRDRQGVEQKLVPLHPDRTRVAVTEDGDISYAYQPKNGAPFGIHADDMLHIPGFGYDGTVGRSKSIIQQAAFQSIGIALAAEDFSGKFFANSGMQKHLIEVPGKMDEELISKLRDEYVARYGGANNSGLPLILTEGLTTKELSLSSVDAELLESRKYQVIDIARAFGVPPFMIGANDTTTSWGTGIEQMTLGFVKFTLQAYLTKIQQEINEKFFPNGENFVEFNLQALLRGDSAAEGKSLREARGGSQGPGWMTLNEVRKVKNLPKLSAEQGGDEIYVPKGKDDATSKPEQTDETDADASEQPKSRKKTSPRRARK